MGLTLSACQTLEGLQQDFTSILPSNDRAQESSVQVAQKSAGCPNIQINEDLRTMAEFSTPSDPSVENQLASLEIVDVQTSCNKGAENVDVEIRLTFDGYLGPAGKRQDSSAHNFAFPYFVAVTDEQSTILAKEIFAATISYSADEDEIRQVETIYQQLPVEDGKLPRYNIIVGFQLDEYQLAYNRAQMNTAAGN